HGRIEAKVYYEDTDCLGVVYYANYLKYFERGRTEFLGGFGKTIGEWNEAGYLFAVYRMEIVFHRPAKLGDRLEVVTELKPKSDYRLIMPQQLFREEEMLVETRVELVCLDTTLEVREFPQQLLDIAQGD
ncbi:MAG: YbgC/FadM family acyl-CoA thioesterase, partial [Deltaproteobacteria bacterium]|nr:YbgC/FadM family acyl-CoA thioesterase [Deltaproteobacteria bacterium]